jgi:phosphonate transport system substrate-binding protein
LTYLEQQIPNVEFSLETSSDYASYEQKLRRGQFHFALPNPYQTIESLSSGYRVTARMAPDSVFKGLIIARKDSQIKQHEQLKQRSIAFTAKTALAATMMPKYYLYMNGVNVDKEMQPRYVTSQFSAIMNVYNKDTFVAATWPVAYKAWQREFPEAANELETLWETPSLINNAWIVRKDVPTSVTDSVTALLVHLSDTEQGKTLLAPTSSDGFIAASDADYQPVREFLNAYQASGLE